MIDWLYSLDCNVFFLINRTLHNPVFDVVLPFLTDLNRMLGGKIFFIALLLFLLVKGKRTGRLVVLLLIITITLSDQFSSFVVKPFIHRERPCRTLEGVRLLIDCGSGKSFPSSHAVNMTAAAVVFAYGYCRWKWWFYSLAGLIAYSRVYVGVHYPSDIIGGAIIGFFIGTIVIAVTRWIEGMIQKRKTSTSQRREGSTAE